MPPRHNRRLPLAVLAALLSAAGVATAADEALPVPAQVAGAAVDAPDGARVSGVARLPSGAEVLDRFIAVTGGVEAYAAIHNRVMSGMLEFVDMGISTRVTVYQSAANRYYAARQTEGLGLVEEGCDGDVAWTDSHTLGPEVAGGPARAYRLRTATLCADYHWRRLYERIECVGVETIDDVPCYKVCKHPADGPSETAWYAQDSGLLVRTEVIVPTSMGNIPTQTTYADYREVCGIRVACREVVRTMGREQRMVIDRIVCNTKIPADRYDLPADIRALVEQHQPQSKPRP